MSQGPFVQGQRYMSETEPELGLGMISAVEAKTVQILFLASGEKRTYGSKGSPLKRVVFQKGDEITLRNGEKHLVESHDVVDELIRYQTSDGSFIDERELSDAISFNRPEERLFSGESDSLDLFNLRFKTYQMQKNWKTSVARGFLGGRVALLPHQLYVAETVAKRSHPRVLLADEVGLGKTIEAGMIIHQMLTTERISRVLILVPDSLVYQWFVEMLRKFNLTFTTINQETPPEIGVNPFTEKELIILNIGLLKGSELARKLLDEAEFDLVVVDEAHLIKWSPKEVSPEYRIVERLAKRVKGLLLLTATPEQLGMEGHFARLKLLDPDRFFDYDKFLEENAHYGDIAAKAKDLIQKENWEGINELLDEHGTGRIFFRNTRANMVKNKATFPKRILKAYPLEDSSKKKVLKHLSIKDDSPDSELFEHKAEWLVQFLHQNPREKMLLICRSKTKVLILEKLLKDSVPNLQVGVFHSDLSFVARDRQAAYFADPEGADILLCTEIGSEGRNFEFAHHLILFDLPPLPEILEQRIGRLDRIGQKSDILIHVPYFLDTFEEILFTWYNEAFDAFAHSSKGAGLVYLRLQSLLKEYLENPKIIFEDRKIFHDFLETAKKEYAEVVKDLEAGRDILIELNSFKKEEAEKFKSEIEKFDRENELSEYMSDVFHHLGVDVEDLDNSILYIKPSDNMYIPHFPGLDQDGKRITYDRNVARRREDVEFLTWDHPMVVGVIELILGNSFGNMIVAQRKSPKPGAKAFVECFFRVSPIADKKYNAPFFFPSLILRTLFDSGGENFTEKWQKEDLDEKITDASVETRARAKSLPRNAVQKILKTSHDYALEKAKAIVEENLVKMREELTHEKNRLIHLKARNPSVKEHEILFFEEQIEHLEKAFKSTEVMLDSFRIVLS